MCLPIKKKTFRAPGGCEGNAIPYVEFVHLVWGLWMLYCGVVTRAGINVNSEYSAKYYSTFVKLIQ